MFTISSPSFQHGDLIPRQHSADGGGVSPPLRFEDAPQGTRSLALLVEDPDAPDPAAPQRIFTQWVVLNIPPDTAGLPLGAGAHAAPGGGRPGRNDGGKTNYIGPAPPVGRHRYFFRLFALDAPLDAPDRPDRRALMVAMQGHIIDETELMGTYERSPARAARSM
jgi:Raf kinase inhibitor-like YbhB/YbcL family protein